MRNILAIIERELRAYFTSPIAYVVLTIFVFLHSPADGLDTHGPAVPVQHSGLGADLDGVSGIAPLWPGAHRDRAFHFDIDGKSNHCGGPQLWNDYGVVARGRAGEQCGVKHQQSGSYLSFDTQSP